MNPMHRFGWPTAALVLVLALLWAHHSGAVAARQQMVVDSLTHANAGLKAHTDTALAQVDTAHQREAHAQQVSRVREQALEASTGRLGALTSALRDSLTRGQQAQLDSLEAAHATTDSLLTAQRDGYRALFLGAAAQRDTLASLLRALQVQNQGLSQALVQARRTPLWNTTVVRATELVLALKGASDLVRGR